MSQRTLPLTALIVFLLASSVVAACPLCGPGQRSIADDMAGANAVVVAQFVSAVPVTGDDEPGRKAVQVTRI